MTDICERTMARRCATQQCDSERGELVREIERLRKEIKQLEKLKLAVLFALELPGAARPSS